MVLSATRLAQTRADAPIATTVIDREMIEASGALQIQELLRLAPGVLVGYQTGHRPAVSYHLFEDQFSRRMQVLVDGRSVYTPAFGGVHWPNLPLTVEDIERIEVIRGPNAASHGANAFLGTINIVTREAALDRGTLINGAVGDNRLRRTVARHGAGGGNLDYRLTAAYDANAGLGNRHDGRHSRTISARADYRAGLHDVLTVQAGYGTSDLEEDTDFDGLAAAIYPPHEASTRNHFQQLRWTHSPAPEQELVLQFYHNYQHLDDAVISDPIELSPNVEVKLPIDYGFTAERYDLELQHTAAFDGASRVVWGTGARLDRVTSAHWFDTAATLDNWHYRLFANLEHRLGPRLLANLGAMVEETDLSDPAVSPRAALNYTPRPGHTLRLAASRAKRFPFLLEQRANERYYFDDSLYEQQIYSPGGVAPEAIDAVEFGYLAQAGKHLTLDLKLYYEEIDNLVSYKSFDYEELPFNATPDDFDEELKLIDNYDRARIRGAELGLDVRLSPANRLWAAYAYTDIDATHNTSQVEYNRSAPYNQLSLLATHDFGDSFTGSAGVYYLGQMQAWESDDRRGDVRRFDLRLAKHLQLGGTHVELAAVGRWFSGDRRGVKLANALEDQAYLSLRLGF